MVKWNTKLTAVELRWIKNAYKKMENNNPHVAFGCKKMQKKINEGRVKAGLEPVAVNTVWRALKKIELGTPLVPIDGDANIKVKCPECGHTWRIK